ncbi:MAG TPA: AsmA family protein, partial [Candidatus Acidoferrales bacterium]|nr:AsmA family protein [Candidatus Acidoferrales bacterium]
MGTIKLNVEQPRHHAWLRKLVWTGGIAITLLLVLYFTATSQAFLKGVILPSVSKTLGANVTVAGAQISPFSHVLLQDLKVQPPGGEPLLTVQQIHANYSLWSILHGNMAVGEVAIESPVVTVIINADGSCNLDALTKTGAKETKPATPAAPKNAAAKPLQVDIKKVALNNATVRLVRKYA